MELEKLKLQLTNEEKILLNSELELKRKKPLIAYLLCIFLGGIGGHRYYMGKTPTAITMTVLPLISFGYLALITGLWSFIDLFLIGSWIREADNHLGLDIARKIIASR